MFGGDPSSSCNSCGKTECSCSCNLRSHSKRCAELSTLPPVIQKCEDIQGQGFRDRFSKPTCTDKPDNFACGKPEVEKCASPSSSCEGEKICDKPNCRSMPVTECTDCKPAWFTWPTLTKMYPVPEGVDILPISMGGRNGTKTSSCGTCGQDRGPSVAPNVRSTCPMMKSKCPDAGTKENKGLFAKVVSIFGKVEKTPLQQICEKLNVEDEQIRHHRDVFNPELVVKKDGYMCPFIKKVDCAGNDECQEEEVKDDGCTCEEELVEESCEEELVEKSCEEEVNSDEDESYCEEEVVEEPSCGCEEPVVDDCQAPSSQGKNCRYEWVCDDGPDDEDEEDECVEDEEGECIREEDDEGEDKLEDLPDFSASGKCDFERLNKAPDCCTDCEQKGASSCTPMSNFVIRVQAPFADGSEESCEAVLEKLCKSRAPMYPEPKDVPKEDCDTKNNIKVVAIIKEEPICVEIPKPCTPPPPSQASTSGPVLDTKPPPCPNAAKSAQDAKNLPTRPCPPEKFTGTCSENNQQAQPVPTPKVEVPTSCPPKVEAVPPPCSPKDSPTPSQQSASVATETCPPKKKIEPPEIAPPVNTTGNQCFACGEKQCSCNKDLKQHLTENAGLGKLPELNPLMKKCDEPAPVPAPADSCSASLPTTNKEPPKQSKCSKPAWNYEATPLTWNPNPPAQQCPAEEPEEDCKAKNEDIPCAEPSSETLIGPELPPCPPKADDSKDTPSEPKNDCCTLSPEELCRKKLRDIMCGCPKCVENRGCAPTEVEVPVWSPPPPSCCTHCGATTRGDNDDCAMCTFVRRARDPYRYDYNCPTSFEFREPRYPPCAEDKDKCNSKVFEMTPEGKPVYEGGMCITRAMNFLWKTNPEETSYRKMSYENESFEGFRRKLPENDEEPGSGCTCEKHNRYRGGMDLDEYRDYIWKATAKPPEV